MKSAEVLQDLQSVFAQQEEKLQKTAKEVGEKEKQIKEMNKKMQVFENF